MKKILVVNTKVPFLSAGAESLETGLITALKDSRYQIDTLKILEKWYPYEYCLKMMIQARSIDIENLPIPSDRLIALKFPSYYIRHPDKVVWFLHHYRMFYELWDSPFAINKNEETEAIRNLIIQADTKMLKEAKKVFAISKTVAERLKNFNGIDSEVLYPPVENLHLFRCENYENFFFFPSRITRLKRQELIVSAMSYVKSPFKLIIGGRVEDEEYLKQLQTMVEKGELQKRVEIKTNLSKDDIISLYANCLAVVFPSFQEDYGYVTLEAMYSKKAVLTCKDSGGPTEFVSNCENGFIVEPDPQAIAEAMEAMYNNKAETQKMGIRGYEKVVGIELSWKRVVQKLCHE